MENENLKMSDVKKELLIDKMEQTIEKQDVKINQLVAENTGQKVKITELETECHDTVTQAQEHVDDVEYQNDELQEQIAEFKAKVLPDEELMFYYGSKMDMILSETYENGMAFLTTDYLRACNFPAPL